MADSPLIKGADAYQAWQSTILGGTPSKTWNLGDGCDHVEIGPGKILLLGGAPGAGKTALLLQWVFNALRLDLALRVLICNVEMSPARLLDRQLSRLSDVPLTLIRRHRVTAQKDLKNIAAATREIQKIAGRLAFARGPYTLQRIMEAADDFQADLLIIDYAQRIDMAGKFNGMREKTNAMMSLLRQMADCGVGVMAASALTRSKDGKGRSSYDGKHLGLASFRESGELEYGADDAFLLFPSDPTAHPDVMTRTMTLAHVKSRDAETKTVDLVFFRQTQKFEVSAPWMPTVPPTVAWSASSATNGNGAKARSH